MASSIDYPFLTKHDTAPFSNIQIAQYPEAFRLAIADARAEINAITDNPEPTNFENTIAALDYSGEKLDRISSIFFNLNSAETNDRMQQIAQEVSPLLTEFGNDITMNAKLFARITQVYNSGATASLTAEQQTLLDKKYKSFSRNGALLNSSDQQILRDIDNELAKLKLTYGENVLAETQSYRLHITDKNDLSGLPEGVVEAAALLAATEQKDGWMFTLDMPSYLPFITYADNRELRKEIAIAAGSKAFRDNEYNNSAHTLRIAVLRHQRARLLGYNSHADFVLEERMARAPEKVVAFLEDMLTKAKPAAEREFAMLSQFALERDGILQLEKWDGSYYSEKLKQKLYNLDDELLKPYFQLSKVLDGAFMIAQKLFGIRFTEVFDVDKYHPDVQTFEVTDRKGAITAVFYADFFPRPGKRNGAWMTSYNPQYRRDGINHAPHVSIVCNFTKPTDTKPSLLTFNEVTTLFHEFGHALHGMLADTVYPGLSGTSVYWDFVELPSQLMENWCYEPEALALFAKHFQTGDIIPHEYVIKIRESAAFLEGMATLRQLSFGMLDMAFHGSDPTGITDIKSFENQVFDKTALYPDVAENCMSVSFSHIFDGGYSSGYYSYKWAEVLDADAFSLFSERGIFDTGAAALLHEHILSKGGTEHPMLLYTRFRGKEPSADALLKRAGLLL